MTLENLRAYCLSLPAAVENQPWTDPRYQYLVTYTVGGRWFCLLDIDEQRVNIKCDPERVVEMQSRYNGAFPAWHMNKRYWNQLDIAALDDELFFSLVDHSFQEVIKKLPKKIRIKYGL